MREASTTISPDQAALYAALAAVAAITTALQGLIVLQAISDWMRLDDAFRASGGKGTQAFEDAKRSAARSRTVFGVFGVVSSAINIAVLVGWYGVLPPTNIDLAWTLSVPYWAVAMTGALLSVAAITALTNLWRLATR